MKKMSFKLMIALLGIFMLGFATSCDDDDDNGESSGPTPVLNENFFYSVSENVLSFSTTLTGNVWWTDITSATDYTATDKAATINYADAGTYPFVCSHLENGVTYVSDTFEVVITVGDTTIYSDDYWVSLTGGYNKSKEWVLDVEGKIFAGPLSFLGTSWNFVTSENDNTDDAWLWDAGASWTFADYPDTRMLLPGDDGYGYMTFDLIGGKNFVAYKQKEDGTETGTFTLNWDTRTITTTNATILRSYKPYAFTVEDGTTDTVWYADMAGVSDWNNLKIYDLTDSVLRVAVSRDQDVQGEGVCWLIYNFVAKDVYDNYVSQDEVFTYSEDNSVNTSYAASDLVGTWKYAVVPQGWISFAASGDQGTELPTYLFGQWDTRSDITTELDGWGFSNSDSVFTAHEDDTFVFGNDGNCTINGVSNTYTYSNGVITFGTALSSEISLAWLTITGTTIKVVDVSHYGDTETSYTPLGTWFGQQNGSKTEFAAIQLVKQE